MKKDELIKIAKNFSIDGEPVKIEKCNSGHINKTYAITYKTKEDEQKKYILQYVNTNVFPNLPELMTNIKKITKYMNQKATEKGENTDRLTITMIDTLDENPNSIYNENWRMEEFIDNTKTYLTTESMEILEEAGKAAGKFQKNLDGFPADELYERLLAYGLFSDKLPPILSSLSFYNYCKNYSPNFSDSWKQYIYYESIRNNNAPRPLAIPNPMAYEKLCNCIKNNWDNYKYWISY